MRSAIFFMPCHPPERPLAESLAYDLECMRWADELGIDEAWVGEIKDLCDGSGTAFFFKQWGGRNKKATGRTYPRDE